MYFKDAKQTFSRRPVSGWSKSDEPFKHKSIFWNSIWLENGTPTTGSLHASTIAQFHGVIRHVQKVNDQRISNSLATKVLNSRSTEIWSMTDILKVHVYLCQIQIIIILQATIISVSYLCLNTTYFIVLQ